MKLIQDDSDKYNKNLIINNTVRSGLINSSSPSIAAVYLLTSSDNIISELNLPDILSEKSLAYPDGRTYLQQTLFLSIS